MDLIPGSCCCCSVAKLCLTLRPHRLQPARLPCPSPPPGVCSGSCPSSWWCHPTISWAPWKCAPDTLTRCRVSYGDAAGHLEGRAACCWWPDCHHLALGWGMVKQKGLSSKDRTQMEVWFLDGYFLSSLPACPVCSMLHKQWLTVTGCFSGARLYSKHFMCISPLISIATLRSLLLSSLYGWGSSDTKLRQESVTCPRAHNKHSRIWIQATRFQSPLVNHLLIFSPRSSWQFCAFNSGPQVDKEVPC